MNEEEKLLSKIKKEYGQENMMEVLGMLKQMNNFMFLDQTKRTQYLKELLMYLNAMLNGDEISQISTYNSKSTFAKKALDEMITSHLTQSISKRKNVESKTNEALERKSQIDSDNELLNNQLLELRIKKEKLESEYKRLLDDADEYESSYMEDIEEKVQEHRRELESQIEEELEVKRKESRLKQEELLGEIEALKKEKSSLEILIKEFREEFGRLRDLTSLINSREEEIVWEKITPENPLYSVSPSSIANYIKSLKETYMNKTGCSKEECDSEFNANCAGLSVIENILITFDSSFYYYPIVKLKNQYNFESRKSRTLANALESALKDIKLPVYTKKEIIELPKVKEDNQDNISSLIREFKYQRQVIDAVAKQRTAEAQLQIALNIISRIAPNSMDYNSLFSKDELNHPIVREFMNKSDNL